jgi:adenosine deaminase/aminodeoxyfutalosine deaminase
MVLSELHLHLEGTIDRECVRLLDPSVTREQADAVWDFTDFTGFLDCFKFAAQRLRGPDDYYLITRRMIAALAAQGIGYAEVTLAAGVVLWRGFDFPAIWSAVRSAQRESPVEIHWNLDAIRQFGPEHVMQVARLATRFVDDGAISFGIGGAEIQGPAAGFAEAYRYARDAGLRLTAHAGETDGPESVRAALAIGAERIGHGIRAAEDPELLAELRDRNIPLEVCITSNVCTGAVSSLEAHPVRRLFDAGVPLTLNTDDPGMFNCTLASEFALATSRFGFSGSELDQIRANAWNFRFSQQVK